MNRAIIRAKRRLAGMGIRVLHDANANLFHLSEMYHRQYIGAYSRADFIERWGRALPRDLRGPLS